MLITRSKCDRSSDVKIVIRMDEPPKAVLARGSLISSAWCGVCALMAPHSPPDELLRPARDVRHRAGAYDGNIHGVSP